MTHFPHMMSDASNQPIGIPGAGPLGPGPSLTKPVFQVPEPQPLSGSEAMVLASWGARFGAWLLDILARLVLTLPLPLLGFLVLADHPFSSEMVDPPDGISNLGGMLVTWILVYYLSAFFYAPITMARWQGATWGKKIVGIRVVTEAGAAPTFGQAFLREPIFKGIVVGAIGGSFLVPLLLNYLWPLWDDQSRAGHDFMARTRVVRAG